MAFVLILAIAFVPVARADNRYDGRYLERAKAYADKMMEKGRDRWGVHTPLFISVLNRKTHDVFPSDLPLKYSRASGLSYVQGGGTDLLDAAANPTDDNEFYDLLYRLSASTGKRSYAEAADASLAYFWKNCQDPNTGLVAWGEHMAWHLPLDTWYLDGMGKFEAAWLQQFDRCYGLGPGVRRAVDRYALGIWRWARADHENFVGDRHVRLFSFPGTTRNDPSRYPRLYGHFCELFALVHDRTENPSVRSGIKRAVRTLLDRSLEMQKKHGENTALWKGWVDQNLRLLVYFYRAERRLPDPLAEKARRVRRGIRDAIVEKMDHPLTPGRTYLRSVDVETLKLTPKYGYATVKNGWAGRMALTLLTYAELAADGKARSLAMKGAKAHIRREETSYNRDDGVIPGMVASKLRLMVRAYHRTDNPAYRKRAIRYADEGIEMFLDDRSPLPKYRSGTGNRYENAAGGKRRSGADRFMLGLYELHRVLEGHEPGPYRMGR